MQENSGNNKIIAAILLILVLIGTVFFLESSKTTTQNTNLHTQSSVASQFNFKAGQAPFFTFPKVAYADNLKDKTQIYNSEGKKVEANLSINKQGAGSEIKLTESQSFTPGKYTLVIDENGRKISQDFLWGVLAINPNKSVYLPGETANLAIAVLDEKGNMVCDADVNLTITDPAGQASIASVKKGNLAVNPECYQKHFTINPDYETNFKLIGGVGTYKMELTATTKNGTYSITDYLFVSQNVDFDVERQTATRIFPNSSYPVLLRVKANRDFKGKITELVPSSFGISYSNIGENYANTKSVGKSQNIIWNVNIKTGQTINLAYTFKTPSISPQFYFIGPLSFSNGYSEVFKETRGWQLAIDAAVCTILRSDNFNRADQSNFGTASDGNVWTNDVETSIASNKGHVVLTPSSGTSTRLGSSTAADFDAKITVQFSNHTSMDAEIRGRFDEVDSYVRGGFSSSGNVFVQERTGGVTRTLQNAVGALTPLSDATDYYIRFQAAGNIIRVKAWKTTDPEPVTWTATGTVTAVTGSGTVGLDDFTTPAVNIDWNDLTFTDLSPACGDFMLSGLMLNGIRIN